MRLLIPLLLVTACGVEAPGGGSTPSTPVARNLLWVSLDTLRADRLGCYGYQRPTTPRLDELAERGVLFEDANAPSPWTMPSHASLFTGRYPSRSGIVSFTTELLPDVPHVAELLAANGFQTVAIVSNSALTMHGLPRGFEVFEYVERGRGAAPSDVTPVALRTLDELDPARPFFAFVHYNAVHARYRAQPRYVREFVRPYDGEVSGRNTQFLAHIKGTRPFTEEDVAHLSDLYDAALRQLDDQLDELFDQLETAGRLADTLVVITSDHGEEFFDHGGVSHAMTQYQELVRVPLLVFGPGVPSGLRVEQPVSLIDLVPTSLPLLGVAVPDGVDGVDLAPLWREPGHVLEERLLYFEADCEPPDRPTAVLDPGTGRAIRDGRFKLHLDEERGAVALYDLQTDPLEQDDLLEAHPDRARALEAALRAFLSAAPATRVETELSEEELRRLQALGYVMGED